jgi:DNA polymerase III subunit delta'
VPFRDLKGHRHLFGLLSSAVGRDAVPQSLLFAGPEGVGKRLAALAMAQTVNCTQPVCLSGCMVDRRQALGLGHQPLRVSAGTSDQRGERGETWQAVGVGPHREGNIDACGTCSACRRIPRGVHPDVLLIEPGESGSIKVEEIRDAIGRAAYRPFEGRRRVTIVDCADTLVPSAQDALLKTLEEPPSGSIFVLVTSRPDALLPTIGSRCYRLRFGRLAEAEVAAILREGHGWSEAEARAGAALADGSAGAALDGRTEDAAEARQSAVDLLQGVAAAKATSLDRLEQAKALAGGAEREELARRLRAAASMLRDLQVLAAGASPRILANADLQDELGALARSYNAERGLEAFSAVDAALDALERNVGPKVVADWIALEL